VLAAWFVPSPVSDDRANRRKFPMSIETDYLPDIAYAGDVSPNRAWEMLTECVSVVLVDVRTEPEWDFVGVPDLRELDKEPLLINWQVYPSMQIHDGFVEDLRELGVNESQPVLFLCRSGVRSRHAARSATEAGYRHCFNVSEGFEGGKDDASHRGRIGGWKQSGLPWRQN